MYGFQARLVLSALGAVVIYNFPVQGMTTSYYYTILAFTLTTSFSVTTQFVSQVILMLLHSTLRSIFILFAYGKVSSLELCQEIPSYCTIVNYIPPLQGSFFTRISDASIGGTYLTLLNTFANLGGTWPKFFVLYFVDFFTVKQCIGGEHICCIKFLSHVEVMRSFSIYKYLHLNM